MSTINKLFAINGVVSTDKSVLQNLNALCDAAGCWLTYDISQGKWAIIINRAGSSVASFNDSNIIGNINVSGKGITELYNSVSVEFPHKDLRDQKDYIELEIPEADRFPNEINNTLNLSYDCINDPIQAEFLAAMELKQSRLDKVITFRTDYTKIGLKAGDLIDVTSTMYGYTNKMFRITRIEESDDEVLGIAITALEYSADIYSTSGLTRKVRNKNTGIKFKQSNTALQEADDASVTGSLTRILAANAVLGIANNLLSKLFGRYQIGTDANGNPIYNSKVKPGSEQAEYIDGLLGNATPPPLTIISSSKSIVCEGTSVTITVGHTCSSCLFTLPPVKYPYTITGIDGGDISVPLTGTVTVTNGTGTLTFSAVLDETAESPESVTVEIGGLTTSLTIYDKKDYTYSVTRDSASITEGGTVVVTLTATGSKTNATIPYTISGSATDKVSSPALTGTVTTVDGTATLTISTTDDAVYQGTQGLTVIFEPTLNDVCNTVGTRSTNITVLDNDTAPPPEPPIPPDINCDYVSVPAVWCGIYDGSDYQLKGMTVREYVYLPKPLVAGEATVTVPLTVSVSKGNPSTITVTSTATVAASSLNVGGYPVRIITSFDTIGPRKLITGTTTTFYGY